MSTATAFGELLRHYRTLRNMSLREVEEQAGMSATNISRIERGLVTPPPHDVIEALAAAVDAPVDQLARAAGIMVTTSDDAIDLEEAILRDQELDDDERAFLLQAVRLVKGRKR